MSKLKSVGLSFLKKMFDILKDTTSKLRTIRKIKVNGKRAEIVNADIDVLGPGEGSPVGRFRLELVYELNDEAYAVEASRNTVLEPENVEVTINGIDIEGADIDVRPNIDYSFSSIFDARVSAGLVFVIELPEDQKIVVFTRAIGIDITDIL